MSIQQIGDTIIHLLLGACLLGVCYYILTEKVPIEEKKCKKIEDRKKKKIKYRIRFG